MSLDKDVLLTLSARDEDLQRALNNSDRKIMKLTEELKKLRAEGVRASSDTTTGLEGIAGSAAKAVTGVLSLAAAYGLLKKAIDAAREAADNGGNRFGSQAEARQELLGQAGSPQEFKRFIKLTESIRKNEGFSFAESAGIVLKAAQTGQTDQAEFFASLKPLGIDPRAAISTTKFIKDGFGGEAGAGTPRQIIEKIIAASKPTPATPGDFATAIPSTSAAFSRLGGTGNDEELLATLSRFTEAFKNPAAAAEKLQSFSTSVANKVALGQIKFAKGEKLEGLALLEALPRLAEEGKLRDASGKKKLSVEAFLADSNAITAETVLRRDRKIIDSRVADIAKAQAMAETGSSALATKKAIFDNDPVMQLQSMANRAQQHEEKSAEDRYGTPFLIANAFRDELTKKLRKEGWSEIGIQMGALGTAGSRLIEGDESYLRRVAALDNDRSGPSPLQGMPPELVDAIRKFAAASDKIEQAAKQLNSASGKSNSNSGPTLAPPNQETGRGPVN